jgi:hypothetical protein
MVIFPSIFNTGLLQGSGLILSHPFPHLNQFPGPQLPVSLGVPKGATIGRSWENMGNPEENPFSHPPIPLRAKLLAMGRKVT